MSLSTCTPVQRPPLPRRVAVHPCERPLWSQPFPFQPAPHRHRSGDVLSRFFLRSHWCPRLDLTLTFASMIIFLLIPLGNAILFKDSSTTFLDISCSSWQCASPNALEVLWRTRMAGIGATASLHLQQPRLQTSSSVSMVISRDSLPFQQRVGWSGTAVKRWPVPAFTGATTFGSLLSHMRWAC